MVQYQVRTGSVLHRTRDPFSPPTGSIARGQLVEADIRDGVAYVSAAGEKGYMPASNLDTPGYEDDAVSAHQQDVQPNSGSRLSRRLVIGGAAAVLLYGAYAFGKGSNGPTYRPVDQSAVEAWKSAAGPVEASTAAPSTIAVPTALATPVRVSNGRIYEEIHPEIIRKSPFYGPFLSQDTSVVMPGISYKDSGKDYTVVVAEGTVPGTSCRRFSDLVVLEDRKLLAKKRFQGQLIQNLYAAQLVPPNIFIIGSTLEAGSGACDGNSHYGLIFDKRLNPLIDWGNDYYWDFKFRNVDSDPATEVLTTLVSQRANNPVISITGYKWNGQKFVRFDPPREAKVQAALDVYAMVTQPNQPGFTVQQLQSGIGTELMNEVLSRYRAAKPAIDQISAIASSSSPPADKIKRFEDVRAKIKSDDYVYAMRQAVPQTATLVDSAAWAQLTQMNEQQLLAYLQQQGLVSAVNSLSGVASLASGDYVGAAIKVLSAVAAERQASAVTSMALGGAYYAPTVSDPENLSRTYNVGGVEVPGRLLTERERTYNFMSEQRMTEVSKQGQQLQAQREHEEASARTESTRAAGAPTRYAASQQQLNRDLETVNRAAGNVNKAVGGAANDLNKAANDVGKALNSLLGGSTQKK